MKFWRISIQTTAVSSLALSFWGLSYLIEGVRGELVHPLQLSEAPLFRPVFLFMNLFALIFLAFVAIVAVGLLRVRRNAVRAYTWGYAALIIYGFVLGALWGSGPLGRSIAAASGVGNLGIVPLTMFPVPLLYPALSVLLVNVAARRLDSYGPRQVDPMFAP